MPKFIGVVLARNADDQTKIAVGSGSDSRDGIFDDDCPLGFNAQVFAASKNMSGAGFPARCCSRIVLPSTCTSKNEAKSAEVRTAIAVLARGDDRDLEAAMELPYEFNAAIVRLDALVLDHPVYQFVLTVPESVYSFGLRWVVRAAFRQLDTA